MQDGTTPWFHPRLLSSLRHWWGEWCGAPSLPLPAERDWRCLCFLVWVSAGRGHVSLLLWGVWHLAQGSHTHSRNTVRTRWHHALCSCWACKVSGSPELPYLLCLTGCITTRLTSAWLLVLPLHPLSGWAVLHSHISSSDRKSKGISAVSVSALCFVGTHQEQPSSINRMLLHWSNFLTLFQLVTPRSFISLRTHFVDHEHARVCLWLPCFDPIHKCQEGRFLHLFFFFPT